MKNDISSTAWHTLSAQEALDRLETTDQGLDPEAAGERARRFGANSLGEEAEPSRLMILLDQVKNPLSRIRSG